MKKEDIIISEALLSLTEAIQRVAQAEPEQLAEDEEARWIIRRALQHYIRFVIGC